MTEFYKNPEIKNAFAEVFDSGDWWKYTGKRVKEFEKKFAETHDCKYGVAVSNGTVALDIIFKAIDVKPGDEVILPAYDFYSLPKNVLNSQAVPVFVDVSKENFTLDASLIQEKITKKTKAIVLVHISSSVGELDKIKKIAKENRIYLIEDCSQAHGATYDNRKAGSWGDIGIFSFGGIKLMTCGQGGAIITNNEDLYLKTYATVYRGHFPDGKMNDLGIIGENYQLSELQAALLLPQLEQLNALCNRREKAAQYLDNCLANIEGVFTLKQFTKTSIRAQMRYSFCVDQDKSNEIVKALQQKKFPVMKGHHSIVHDERLQGAFSNSNNYINSLLAQNSIIGIHHTFLLNETVELDRFIKELQNSILS